MEAKEEVRNRLEIADVIGEYVQLKRAGRSFKGISPFTQEKTPSFFVSPEKQIWHCFSTNKGGDVFSFVMEVEGLDFKGALDLLARKAGIDLSQYQKGDGTFAKKRERMADITRLAERYFQQTMVKNKTAWEYIFKKRGLNKTVVQDFSIGYAPDKWDELTKILLKRGYSEKELIDAGISARRREIGDLFRGRMMLPLKDGQGKTLGFTGRLIADNPKAPKYLNTPQTILYDKSRHVFGLDQAKEAIRKENYVVAVEGNLDVVSSHQVGVKQVVAIAGTALTEYHMKALARFTNNIRLCFDGDKAGVAATERAIPIAQNAGVKLSIITVPEPHKDPDELIQADKKAWEELLKSPRDVVEWTIDQYAGRVDIKTAEGKATVSSKALELVRKINDPVQTEYYVNYLAKILETSPKSLQTKLSQKPVEQKANLKPTRAKQSGPDPLAYQDAYLGLCALYPAVRGSMQRISAEHLIGEERQQLFTAITKAGNNPFQTEETHGKIVLFKAEERYSDPRWTDSGLYHEAVELANKIKDKTKEAKLREISRAIHAAHEQGDHTAAAKLSKQWQDVKDKEQ